MKPINKTAALVVSKAWKDERRPDGSAVRGKPLQEGSTPQFRWKRFKLPSGGSVARRIRINWRPRDLRRFFIQRWHQSLEPNNKQ